MFGHVQFLSQAYRRTACDPEFRFARRGRRLERYRYLKRIAGIMTLSLFVKSSINNYLPF